MGVRQEVKGIAGTVYEREEERAWMIRESENEIYSDRDAYTLARIPFVYFAKTIRARLSCEYSQL